MFPRKVEARKEKIMDYLESLELPKEKVSDSWLMLQCFIHKSYSADYPYEVPDNERLEFLGDAILGFVVAKYLYLDFSEEEESKLTLYKIALVREENLAKAAKEIKLGDMLFLGHWEEKTWWRWKSSILADAMESLIWYIYMDFGIQEVENFIKKYIYSKVNSMEDISVKSYKSSLQEYTQKNYKSIPVYEDIEYEVDGKNNVVTYKCNVYLDSCLLGTGYWPNKKTAQEEAAKDAYQKSME